MSGTAQVAGPENWIRSIGPLRDPETGEDPRDASRDAEARVPRGHADDEAAVDAHRATSEPAAEHHARTALRPRRLLFVAEVRADVELPHHFEPLLDRAGERQAVHVD